MNSSHICLVIAAKTTQLVIKPLQTDVSPFVVNKCFVFCQFFHRVVGIAWRIM